MKKITRTLFLAVALSIVIGVWFSSPISASAIDSVSGEWSYDVEDGAITITGYSGTATELVVPSEIDGNKVSGIGAYAFLGSSTIENVVISDGVKTIGDSAFYECSALKTVSIGADVEEIGDFAFGYSDALLNISVSSKNKNYCSVDNVLFNKEKTEILQYPVANVATFYNIPETVVTIKTGAFEKSANLVSVNIPTSVKTIERAAFNDSDALKSIIIPDSVEVIDWRAFSYCDKLENITMSKNIAKIGGYAFDYTLWYKNQMKNANGVIYIGDFAYNSNFENDAKVDLVLKAGTRGVADLAFAAKNVISITLPDTLEYIGERAFLINYLDFEDECAKNVVIPKSVKGIEEYGIGYYVSGAGVAGFVGRDIIPEFKIEGVAGSVAEAYAKEKGIEFVAQEESKHICSGGTATCTQKAICEDCKETYGELDLNNHQVANGAKEGVHAYCVRCGVTTNEKHNFTETVTKEVTATENGIKKYSCNCGYSYTTEITMLGAGEVKVEADENNDFSAMLTDVTDIKSKITITKEEQTLIDSGLDLNVVLKLESADSKVDAKEKEAIQNKLGKNTLGIYLDIRLVKQIGTYESNVENTNGTIKISFEVPQSLINADKKIEREYKIIRYHEGDTEKVTVLDATYDKKTKTITFETDRFSTYAIVYADKAKVEDDGKDDVLGTGVISVTTALSGVTALSGLTAFFLSKKKKEY